jgi:YgiT-type zinc finger domain-containing protein
MLRKNGVDNTQIWLRLRRVQKSLEKNSPNKSKDTKASALLCPTCCVEYVEVEFDLEVDSVILHNVKALRCPECEEELFTPKQYEIIKKRINNSN